MKKVKNRELWLVQGYLSVRNKNLVTGYVRANMVSESNAINTAINEFFSSMPQKEIERLLQLGKQPPIQEKNL